MNKNFAVLFVISSYTVLKRYEIDLTNVDEDMPVNENTAFLVFKNARNKFNIKGKAFMLFWSDHTYFITRTRKDYLTYELDATKHEHGLG